LSLHGIGRSIQKRFDSQVLFNPLEKEFDLPAAFVKVGNGEEEIGKFYGGISPSAVSQNTRRLRSLLQGDPKLSREVGKLIEILSQ
jgi:hypothetical protein